MTTNIGITSDQFAKDTTFRTADGKTIRVKHFCVEEPTKISLEDLKVGQKARTFKGEVLTYVQKGYGPTWPHYFRTESGDSKTFTSTGIYSPDLIPTDSDIAEILPFEAPLVPLGDLPIGSTFRTRGGLVCTLEKSNAPDCGSFFGRPPNTDPAGLFYDADGSCRKGNVYDAVEVVTRANPKLSIEHAVKGDTFVLRDGSKYVYTGERVSDIIRTKLKDGCASLNFNPDGSAYGLRDYADVVEIIPAPKVSIAGAKAGDVFTLRNGRNYVCTGKTSPFSGSAQGYCKGLSDDASLYFRPDGSCPNRGHSHDVIEFISAPPEPRVSIEGSVRGDKFRIRDGRVYTCTGERAEKGRFRTIDKNGNSGLTFDPDGRAPGLPDYADVVEIIPAPKPSLVDRVTEQIRLQPDAIKEIVLSYSDYKEFPKEYPNGGCRSYFKGVRLLHSQDICKGSVRIELKAD